LTAAQYDESVRLLTATGNIYAGLVYPIIVAALCFVVGNIFLKESHGTLIWDEVSKKNTDSWTTVPLVSPASTAGE